MKKLNKPFINGHKICNGYTMTCVDQPHKHITNKKLLFGAAAIYDKDEDYELCSKGRIRRWVVTLPFTSIN